MGVGGAGGGGGGGGGGVFEWLVGKAQRSGKSLSVDPPRVHLTVRHLALHVHMYVNADLNSV